MGFENHISFCNLTCSKTYFVFYFRVFNTWEYDWTKDSGEKETRGKWGRDLIPLGK